MLRQAPSHPAASTAAPGSEHASMWQSTRSGRVLRWDTSRLPSLDRVQAPGSSRAAAVLTVPSAAPPPPGPEFPTERGDRPPTRHWAILRPAGSRRLTVSSRRSRPGTRLLSRGSRLDRAECGSATSRPRVPDGAWGPATHAPLGRPAARLNAMKALSSQPASHPSRREHHCAVRRRPCGSVATAQIQNRFVQGPQIGGPRNEVSHRDSKPDGPIGQPPCNREIHVLSVPDRPILLKGYMYIWINGQPDRW
jgi:hypothetical protein